MHERRSKDALNILERGSNARARRTRGLRDILHTGLVSEDQENPDANWHPLASMCGSGPLDAGPWGKPLRLFFRSALRRSDAAIAGRRIITARSRFRYGGSRLDSL